MFFIFAILIAGIYAFIYFHGNTKHYDVPKEVHDAIVSQKVSKSGNDIRIMSSNLLVSYPSWHGDPSKLNYQISAKPRAKIYFELLKTYRPDVVGIQELCDMWYCCLLRNNMGYKFIFPISTLLKTRMTSIIYNSNTTSVLKKGKFYYSPKDDRRLRLIVWALFKDKNSKKQYIVTSTHFSLIRENKEASLKMMEIQTEEFLNLSKRLKEKYNVPIFHTGDFNSVNNIENWAELYPWYSKEEIEKLNPNDYMTDQAPSIYTKISENLTDAKLAAKEYNSICSTTINSPSYDHIFLNNDVDISRYVSISSPAMHQMSDHYSIFIDAEIS